ncbi:hypothetical protein SAMN05421821_101401 [Mucilaginibacter lappiensis]|uniref:PD-(D/E)XK nuclease superfamily protein n=1 Tax=Mucilaginibacter lappiensis TaxID=354630 RepID=A0ABR6PD59_9SPHI|nr:hypothetical protein [Mucilaginibacter lappiensis]MBB6107682.1 hypothetical protein [Mucilaginibacter lappiensis]SIQ00568.1 hypothetical protein SAMN05421821_101401 [Mucilaginibacter lappiensis]
MNAGINQKLAPIRFLFLIQPDNQERFSRAMELAWSLWGGIHSPIFAYYQELPVNYRIEFNIGISTIDYYKNTIENYDPDIILFDADITEPAVSALSGERNVKSIEKYLEELINGQYDHAISVTEIASHLLKNEFKFVRSDKLTLALPIIAADNLLLKAFIGALPEFVKSAIADIYDGNDAFGRPVLDWASMENYRDTPVVDVLDMNIYKLNSWSTKPYKRGAAIYFMRSDRLQDVINYWNLRAAGWQVVPFAIDLAENPYIKGYIARFAEWVTKSQKGNMSMVTNLVGNILPQNEADAAWTKVLPADSQNSSQRLYSWQGWFPRFWASYEYQDADQIKSEIPFYHSHFDHYDVIEERIEFKAQQLPFEAHYNLSRESAYKIVLEISLHDEYAEHAELLTGITNHQLRQVAAPIDFREWRLSRAGVHRTINRSDDRIMLSLPKALDFFRFYFKNTGYDLKETANSKLAKEVLKNIGGLRFGRSFLRVGPLKIIELFEGGREISHVQLVAEIKKTMGIKKVDDARYFVNRLLEHKIIEMGARIQCAVCDQHGFFLPGALSEKITCPVCRNQYALPMADPDSIAWSYRGIGPFTRTNKADGVMAVFAALSLFQSEFGDTRGKSSALFGFELSKGKSGIKNPPKEIDLCLLIQNSRDEYKQPDLVFCECKTYKKFTEKDIERMKVLGDAFPGSVLTLATLNEQLDEQEIGYISELVKYFQRGRSNNRPLNPVLILTGKELLPEQYFDGFRTYKDKIKPYHQFNDYLGAITEFSITEYLHIPNWWEICEKKREEHLAVRQGIGQIIKGLKDRF